MFHLEALAERLPLMTIFQNMTFIHYLQRLANVTKIAKFNLPSIYAGVHNVKTALPIKAKWYLYKEPQLDGKMKNYINGSDHHILSSDPFI